MHTLPPFRKTECFTYKRLVFMSCEYDDYTHMHKGISNWYVCLPAVITAATTWHDLEAPNLKRNFWNTVKRLCAIIPYLWESTLNFESVKGLFKGVEIMNAASDKHVHLPSLMHPPLPIWQQATFQIWRWSKRKLISKYQCLLFLDMK